MNQDDSIAVEYPRNIHEDMVHSSGLRGYLEVMQHLGIDPMPLLAKHEFNLHNYKMTMHGFHIQH